MPNTPRYAFGYGLSYTQFALSDLELNKTSVHSSDSIVVHCTVRNTGKYAGEEVVQLYLQDMFASVTRPLKELKDFRKVMLQPGESKRLQFIVNKDKLAFYDQQMNWTVEPGEFNLMLGTSSDNILLERKFELIN